MANALLTAVSGLFAHRRMLDVVGNNLANSNTTGYKSQRALFSDLLYETVRPASASGDGSAGAINPSQIGAGVQVSQVGRMFNQGTLESTGGEFDYAIEGEGFFVVNDGNKNLFSRAGAFSLDPNQILVDPTTGHPVQRVGTIGDPTTMSSGFQVPGDNNVIIPFGNTIPGERSTVIDVSGNLAVESTPAAQQEYTSAGPLLSGGVPATATTLLNDLDSVGVPYASGDQIDISGVDADGSFVTNLLSVDATTTVGDLTAAVNAAYQGASGGLDGQGNFAFTADASGLTSLQLRFNNIIAPSAGQPNADTSANGINFTAHVMNLTTIGKDVDSITQELFVFDELGRMHKLDMEFTWRDEDHAWDLAVTTDSNFATITDGFVEQIQFNDDGSLQQALGIGVGDASITLQMAGIAASQTVAINFGPSNFFEGLTQTALPTAIDLDQNGIAPGTLTKFDINPNGMIEGISTNGKTL